MLINASILNVNVCISQTGSLIFHEFSVPRFISQLLKMKCQKLS